MLLFSLWYLASRTFTPSVHSHAGHTPGGTDNSGQRFALTVVSDLKRIGGRKMKFLRWLLCFPVAMIASVIGWALVEKIFSGIASTYGGGILRSIVGLLPLLITAAFPTVASVVAGVFASPSKERRVCFGQQKGSATVFQASLK